MEGGNKVIYAPVMIITLNRYEHLKRCLEALSSNTAAEMTEVYISVDYPTKEEWVKGHDKIVEYLKVTKWNFKKVNIYIQEANLGAPENSKFLREKAFEKYDRVFMMEDDIEVSPNFIEYMNQCLEYGEKDEKCHCVCGWSRNLGLKEETDYTIYKGVNFCAWGVGVWREKYKKMEKTISFPWLDAVTDSVSKMTKLYRTKYHLFYLLFNDYVLRYNPVFQYKNGDIRPCDMIQSTYMIVNDLYAIYPVTSKSRNHGFDGTGLTSRNRKDMKPDVQAWDEETDFEIKAPEKNKISKKINKKMQKEGEWYDKKVVFKSYLYFLFCQLRKRLKGKGKNEK